MSTLVKPFKGIYYNVNSPDELKRLICPPYDVITPQDNLYFLSQSEFNFCRIIYPCTHGNYRNQAKLFAEWFKKKILVQDKKESFYLYEQIFNYENKTYRRIGLLGLLRLDKEGIIFPHEYTHAGPKRDRAKILSELKANLSPIFVISTSPLKALNEISQQYQKKSPFIDFVDYAGIKNRVWRISQEEEIKALIRSFSRKKLIIADGHHRFEVARSYFLRNQKRSPYRDLNYIFTYFTDENSGILVLPTHRIVNLNKDDREVLQILAKFFLIEKANFSSIISQIRGTKKFSFGFARKNVVYFLVLKDEKILDKIIKTERDRIYRNLDVYILHKFVFKLLKIKTQPIEYTHEVETAKDLKAGQAMFILREPKLKDICEIARKGYKLPQKSTYFYPKLLSGLLIRRFEEK